jgi:hypothetical protein
MAVRVLNATMPTVSFGPLMNDINIRSLKRGDSR